MSERDLTTSAPLPTRRKAKKDQRVRRRVRELCEDAGYLQEGRYRPLVVSLARTIVLGDDIWNFIRSHGVANEDGALRESLDRLTRVMGVQLKIATALGLSPTAVRKVTREREVDIWEDARGEVGDGEIVEKSEERAG